MPLPFSFYFTPLLLLWLMFCFQYSLSSPAIHSSHHGQKDLQNFISQILVLACWKSQSHCTAFRMKSLYSFPVSRIQCSHAFCHHHKLLCCPPSQQPFSSPCLAGSTSQSGLTSDAFLNFVPFHHSQNTLYSTVPNLNMSGFFLFFIIFFSNSTLIHTLIEEYMKIFMFFMDCCISRPLNTVHNKIDM